MQRFAMSPVTTTRSPAPLPLLVVLAISLTVLGCGGGSGEATGNDNTAAQQPTIDRVTPEVLDADGMDPLVITGTGLRGPLFVEMQDERGEPIGPAIQASTTEDGTRAECEPPFAMPREQEMEVLVQVRTGDGQRAERPRRITLRRSYRSIDGTGNNPANELLGSAEIALIRKVAPDYADGDAALAGPTRANPRAVSNAVCAQNGDQPNAVGATDYLWQWGQFLDHDIDLTPETETSETADILVPAGDPWFDPFGDGSAVIPLTRSAYVDGSSPRQQVNAITAFIDASNVYGSDEVRARALRALDGSGRLRVSAGNLLPFNTSGLPNAGGDDNPALFVAGDVRANEQLALTCMHTLFVREHNRLADRIRDDDPRLSGDRIYEEARRIVGAQMQVITFEEFLPLLLGEDLGPYRGYDPNVDPGIANVFSTAGYRLGHSLLSNTLLRVDADGNEIAAGHLGLRDAFFRPDRLATEGGIEPVLRGLAAQVCQELDARLVDDVRNFLFGPPGAGGLDLASLNIQRGREHGLASYNDVRAAYGLATATSFAQITSDTDRQAQLAAAYDSVDDVDVWIGGLCEDHRGGGMVGELFAAILRDQFDRLRHGDRYWYERAFSGRERDELRRTRLSDIIRRNTSIGNEIPRNVFRADLPAAPVVATR